MMNRVGYTYLGHGNAWGISVFSAQHYCEPKTILKKLILKNWFW
jgi:hypothetical protein